jgi:hypothetical protein
VVLKFHTKLLTFNPNISDLQNTSIAITHGHAKGLSKDSETLSQTRKAKSQNEIKREKQEKMKELYCLANIKLLRKSKTSIK